MRNAGLKEIYKQKNFEVENNLKNNLEIELKIEVADKHLKMLRDEKLRLSQVLLSQMKDVQRLKSENLVLKNSVDMGKAEVSNLVDENQKLKKQNPG